MSPSKQDGSFEILAPEGSPPLQHLLTSLREASFWCARHVDPRASRCFLRPERLPSLLADLDTDLLSARAALRDAVRAVIHWRASQPEARGAGALPGGRMMFCSLEGSLCDGAAAAESLGFFDVNNVPPWETWVALVHEPGHLGASLLVWVPDALVSLARGGIDVNPEECIGWIKGSGTALERMLDEAGALR